MGGVWTRRRMSWRCELGVWGNGAKGGMSGWVGRCLVLSLTALSICDWDRMACLVCSFDSTGRWWKGKLVREGEGARGRRAVLVSGAPLGLAGRVDASHL